MAKVTPGVLKACASRRPTANQTRRFIAALNESTPSEVQLLTRVVRLMRINPRFKRKMMSLAARVRTEEDRAALWERMKVMAYPRAATEVTHG